MKKKKEGPEVSMIGKIIDLPFNEFKIELVKQKINIGVMKNISLNLISAYNELSSNKEGIVNECIKNRLSKNDPQVQEVLEGLFLEMMKIEEKVLYLNKCIKELEKLDD